MHTLIHLWVLVSFTAVTPAKAAEVDTYHGHPENLEDSLPQMNTLFNELLKVSVKEANKKHGCDKDRLYKKLIKQFVGGPSGFLIFTKVEKRIAKSTEYDWYRVPLKESIYQDFGTKKLPSQITGGTAPLMKVNGYLVGSDKFGHFLASGWQYFHLMETNGDSLSEVTQYGYGQETGLFGAPTTGVISYGDLAANYNGLLFWRRMLSWDSEGIKTPYLQCVADGSHWEISREIDMADYVDATWDESLNPSMYYNEHYEMSANIQINKAMLENPNFPVPGQILDLIRPNENKKYKMLSKEQLPISPMAFSKEEVVRLQRP